jgi:hypothetical protein
MGSRVSQVPAGPIHTAPVWRPSARAGGRPLDGGTRSMMEQRFAHDFSQVRVHSDSAAASSAAARQARAYTLGNHVVFGAGQYAAGSAQGQRLIAHELAHVVQQAGQGARIQAKPAMSQRGDVHERQADLAAARVMAGQAVGAILTPAPPMIQREEPAAAKPEEKKEPAEIVAEGLKVVADQATENNPALKKLVLEPLKLELKGRFGQLSTGEKAATISLGAATLGIGAGSLLSDPKGRKQLEGINLAAPLTLIPFMPVTGFKYTLPSGESPELRKYKFDLGFDVSDLINLRTKRRGLPEMKLKANFQWGYDPVTGATSVIGANASLGLVPGLAIDAGVYKDRLKAPTLLTGPGGMSGQSMRTLPGGPSEPATPEFRLMFNVDLLKFKPGELVRQLRGFF